MKEMMQTTYFQPCINQITKELRGHNLKIAPIRRTELKHLLRNSNDQINNKQQAGIYCIGHQN